METYMIVGMTKEQIFHSQKITAENRSMAHMLFGAKLGSEIASQIIGTYDFSITRLQHDTETDEEFNSEYKEMIELCCEVCLSYLEG